MGSVLSYFLMQKRSLNQVFKKYCKNFQNIRVRVGDVMKYDKPLLLFSVFPREGRKTG